MNSHQMRTLAGGAVAALVLTALFLLVDKTPLVIAGYLFSLLGVIEFFGTVYYVAGGGRNSYLTNAAFPLAVQSYAVINTAFSVIMAAAEYFHIYSMPVGWFIFFHIIFVALLIWRLLAMRSGQEEIERVEQHVKESTLSWKFLISEAQIILDRTDCASRKDVSAVCDALHYADPMSSPALAAIDDGINENLTRLGAAVDAGDAGNITSLCAALQRQIRERNIKTKMLK